MDAAFITTLTAAGNDRRFRGNDPLGLLARYGVLRAKRRPVAVEALLDTATSSYEAHYELADLVEYGYLAIVGEDMREWRSDADERPVVLASEVAAFVG
jgi:hypothetical protein